MVLGRGGLKWGKKGGPQIPVGLTLIPGGAGSGLVGSRGYRVWCWTEGRDKTRFWNEGREDSVMLRCVF